MRIHSTGSWSRVVNKRCGHFTLTVQYSSLIFLWENCPFFCRFDGVPPPIPQWAQTTIILPSLSISSLCVERRWLRGKEGWAYSNDSKKVVFFLHHVKKNITISDFSSVLTGTHIKLCINPNLEFGVEDVHWPPRVRRRQSPKVWQLLIFPEV